MYAAAAPDECTWGNGTGSAGSLAAHRAQSAGATPNSETTKPPHENRGYVHMHAGGTCTGACALVLAMAMAMAMHMVMQSEKSS